MLRGWNTEEGVFFETRMNTSTRMKNLFFLLNVSPVFHHGIWLLYMTECSLTSECVSVLVLCFWYVVLWQCVCVCECVCVCVCVCVLVVACRWRWSRCAWFMLRNTPALCFALTVQCHQWRLAAKRAVKTRETTGSCRGSDTSLHSTDESKRGQ